MPCFFGACLFAAPQIPAGAHLISASMTRCATWCAHWVGRQRGRHSSILVKRRKPKMALTKRDRLLTVDDVAERLQCSTKSVRRSISNSDIEAIRIGPARRSIRITETALAVYLATRNT